MLFLRSISLTLAICACMFLSAPAPAQAIPTAGDYEFTSGLTGSFTSNGLSLTTWLIGDQITSINWAPSIGGIGQNDENVFTQRQGLNLFTYNQLSINWVTSIYAISVIENNRPTQNVGGALTWQRVGQVPEPSVIWFMAIGLLVFLVYELQQRRQAGCR